MDFKFSAEDEAFRKELSGWLKANLPKAGKSEGGGDSEGEFMRESSADDWNRRVEWHKKMHAGGWVGISWPKEYGGRGATLTQQIIYNEEMAKVNSPMLVNGLGIMLVGPTHHPLGHRGTEEKAHPENSFGRRALVPGIFRARRRLRRRQPADPRGRGRRLLYRQRAEGLDLGRASRRHVHPAGAHRSRGAQAQGHQLHPGRYAQPRRDRASARADYRRREFQRGLLRGRARCRRRI